MNPFTQTDEQLRAGPSAEVTLTDPILESQGVQQPAEESTAATDALDGSERLAAMADRSATKPMAIAEAAGSSKAVAGVANIASESMADKPVAPKEQTALPKASEGVVGHAI